MPAKSYARPERRDVARKSAGAVAAAPLSVPSAVVRRTAGEAGERLSAASRARTEKTYRVPGRSPVTTAAVWFPPTLWIFDRPW